MISIIVPVYNEEKGIGEFINYLKENISGEEAELIFVDGGSTDKTIQICKNNKVSVFISPEKGRASQMNYGAEKAKGQIYYFLHSDSLPPPKFLEDIKKNIKKGYSSGCYRLSFYPEHALLKFYAWFTRFDIDLFRFGDQSLFVKKESFNEVRGYNETLNVMEDQQIIKDLKKRGSFIIMKDHVVTSSRKYTEIGVFKLQLLFALIVLLYYLGVNQKVIVNFYTEQLK